MSRTSSLQLRAVALKITGSVAEPFDQAAMRKVSKTGILVFLAVQVAILLCFVLQRQPTPQETSARKHILVLSSWRSGSSFVGQLFSQHPSVFYLMEPAWHVWATMYQNSATALHMAVRDLVRSVFQCDMSVFDAYLSGAHRNKSALFQWEASRALCSPPACDLFQRSDIVSKHACKTLCGNYPFSKVEEACKTYSHVVLKEVRFFDIKVLYPLLTDPSLDLRIIHLVRDPRAVFHSRKNVAKQLARDTKIVVGHKDVKNRKPYAAMEAICKSHTDIYAEVKPPLRDRYILVRYEDIVAAPLAKAAQLYQFAGLPFLPSLQSWVQRITNGPGLGPRAFDTDARDARNVSQAWRKALSYPQTEKLQTVCKEAMEHLGYLPARSEDEQKDTAFDLLAKLNAEAACPASSTSKHHN